MNKVNFLQQNNRQKKKRKDRIEDKQPLDDWTEPAVDNNIREERSGAPLFKKLINRLGSANKNVAPEKKEAERLRQASKEVLADIKDKKIDAKAQKVTGAAVSAPGGLMKGIFSKANKAGAGAKALSGKQAIAQVQEAASQERKQRTGGPDSLVAAGNKKAVARKEALPDKAPTMAAIGRPAAKTSSRAKPKKTPESPSTQNFSKNQSNWHAPKILKTNLAEGELTAFFNWQKFFKSLGANLLLACLLIGIAYFGLVLWEMKVDREERLIGAEIENLAQKIIQMEKKMTVADELQRKIELAKFLIEEHIYWTNFFVLLERSTLAEVFYTSAFSGDVNNTQFNLAAVAKSYADISNQIKAMKNDQNIESVEVKSGNMAISKNKSEESGASNVQFQLVFSIKPDLFTE